MTARFRLTCFVGLTLFGCQKSKEDYDTGPSVDTEDTSFSPLPMVLVSAGTFTMGCSPEEVGAYGTEAIEHEVTLTRDFYVGVTEVTEQQFEQRMEYIPPDAWGLNDEKPVVMVTWHEAAKFANAASATDGFEPCYACSGTGTTVTCDLDPAYLSPYECDGYRLPSEAEWEYAARAGTTTAFYNGGNLAYWYDLTCTDPVLDNGALLTDIAWYCWNNKGGPQPVRELAPNPWGLYDTAGNVWEWVGDWYADYANAFEVDPYTATGSSRILRGGAWDIDADAARVAYRGATEPSHTAGNSGFRIARTAP